MALGFGNTAEGSSQREWVGWWRSTLGSVVERSTAAEDYIAEDTVAVKNGTVVEKGAAEAEEHGSSDISLKVAYSRIVGH